MLAVVGTMKAGKSTTINAIWGRKFCPTVTAHDLGTDIDPPRSRKNGTGPPSEHIQPVRNLLITLQEKLATPAGQQVAQSLQQTGDTANYWIFWRMMSGLK